MWQYDLNLLQSMHKYWRIHPPLHKLAAGFMGYEAPSENQTIDLEEFINSITKPIF